MAKKVARKKQETDEVMVVATVPAHHHPIDYRAPRHVDMKLTRRQARILDIITASMSDKHARLAEGPFRHPQGRVVALKNEVLKLILNQLADDYEQKTGQGIFNGTGQGTESPPASDTGSKEDGTEPT